MKKQIISEEFKRMRVLAGLITESQLNEDNLEVKRIAKDLYSFLKKNGVEVKLLAHGDKSYKKIGQIDQGMSMGKTMDNAGIISYYDDPTTKQTIIQIQLYGGPTSKDLVVGVEKKLLATYPGLEQFDRQEIPGKTNFQLNFRVREKTTKKGGLVGNTKTNPKPAAQPQAESQLSESLPMGKSKPAQDAANALNSIIGKIEMPNLSQEARVAASKIISLIDQDQNMEESLNIESIVNETLAKFRKK